MDIFDFTESWSFTLSDAEAKAKQFIDACHIFFLPHTNYGKCNVFTGVCRFTGGSLSWQGVSVLGRLCHRGGLYHGGGLCSGGLFLWGFSVLEGLYPGGGGVSVWGGSLSMEGVSLTETPCTSTTTDGTHPTGMHSCSFISSVFTWCERTLSIIFLTKSEKSPNEEWPTWRVHVPSGLCYL